MPTTPSRRGVHVEGFVVKDYRARPSNWRSEMALGEYLEHAGVPGIEGIDTRALVRHIRTHGAQEAVISSVTLDPDALVARAKASPGLVGRDLVKEVTCAEPYDWECRRLGTRDAVIGGRRKRNCATRR